MTLDRLFAALEDRWRTLESSSSFVLLSEMNFELTSGFRWFLVAPAFLWHAALITVGRQDGASRW